MSKKTTEKGPKPLRGIRNPDLYPSNGDAILELLKLGSLVAYSDYSHRRGNIGWDAITADSLLEKHYDPSNPMWEVGQSTYDNDIMMDATSADVQDTRAHNLPWWSQWGSGVGKMLGTFATTTVDGVVGTLAGVVQGIGNSIDNDENTSFLDGLWNNKVTNAMAEASEALEEALPNYQSLWELNAPFWERMLSGEGAANFWANDILKNAGFTMGAAASIYLTGGIAGVLGKGLKGLSLISKLSKAAEASLGLAKAGKFAKWTANTLASTIGESSIEALNTYRDNKKLMDLNLAERTNSLKAQALAEYRESIASGVDPSYADAALKNKIAKIEDDAAAYNQEAEGKLIDASNAVLAANVAILSLSNNLTLGSMIRGGYGNAKSLLSRAVKTVDGKPVTSTSDIARGMLNGTLGFESQEIKHGAAKVAGKWALQSTQEGLEEGEQGLASSTALISTQAAMNKWARENSSLGSLINPDAQESVADWTKALGKAYEEEFGTATSPGWTEVAAGFISGMFGVASVHRNKEGKIRPTWEGGFKEAHESIYGEKAATEEAIAQMQLSLTSNRFGERVRNAVENLAILSKMSKALEDNDTRGYKNAEVELLVLNALNARDFGMLDSYMEMFDELAKGVSDKDVTELRALAKKQGTDDGGLAEKTDDEIKQLYKEKAESAKQKLQDALDNYDRIDKRHGDKFSDETRRFAVREWTFKETLLHDTQRRMDEVDDEILELENKGDKITPTEKTILEEKKKAKKELEKQAYKLGADLDSFIEEPEKLQKNIENLISTAKKRELYKQAENAIAKYKEANTIADILDIYDNSPKENKEEVLNQAINQAEGETKTKLQLFKNYMEDVQVLDDLIMEQFPLSKGEESLAYQLFFGSALHQAVNEILEDDSPVLTRLNLKDKLLEKMEELKTLRDEAAEKAEGLTIIKNDEGNAMVDIDSAYDNGVITDDDFEQFINEQGEEDIRGKERFNNLKAQAYEAFRLQDLMDKLNTLIGKIDLLDKLRKAAPKPKPKSTSTSTKPTGKGKQSTSRNQGEGKVENEEELTIETEEEEEEEEEKPTSRELNDKEKKLYNSEVVTKESGVSYIKIKKKEDYTELLGEDEDPLIKGVMNIATAIENFDSFETQFSNKNDAIKAFVKLVEKTPMPNGAIKQVEKFLAEKGYKQEAKPQSKPKEEKKENEEETKEKPVVKTGKTLEELIAEEEAKDLQETLTSLIGNQNPMYVKSKIKEGRLISYAPKGHLQEWWLKQGINITGITEVAIAKIWERAKEYTNVDDIELHGVPVYYLHHSDRPNDIQLAFSKASIGDLVQDIPGLKSIKIDGMEYYIFGNLGYDGKYSPRTKDMFESLRTEIQGEHKEEGWYVHNKTNRLKDISSGYIIKAIGDEEEVTTHLINSLLSNPKANPYNLKIDTIVWGVVEGTEEEPYMKHPSNVKDEDLDRMLEIGNPRPGLVYMYVPNAKGLLVPIYMETLFLQDLDKSEDNHIRASINKKLAILADPESTWEKKKLAIKDLNEIYLVFSSANNIHVNDEENKFEPGTIYATINGVPVKIIDFNEETNLEENLEKLKETFELINPKLKINLSTLENNPSSYAQAGILRTNASVLGTEGVETYIYPIDEDNNYVINLPHKAVSKPTFNTKERVHLNGEYLYFDGENFWNAEGKKINDKDGSLHMALKMSKERVQKKKSKNTTYFIDGETWYADNGHGGLTLLTKTQKKQAEETIKKEKAAEKRKLKAAEKAAEKEKKGASPAVKAYKESLSKTTNEELEDIRTAYLTNTVESYDAYLDKYPEGKFRNLARNGLRELGKMEGGSEINTQEYKDFLEALKQTPVRTNDERAAGFKMILEFSNGLTRTTFRTFKVSEFKTPDKHPTMKALMEKLEGTDAEYHTVEDIEKDGTKKVYFLVRRNAEDDWHSPEALLEILKGAPANAEELFGFNKTEPDLDAEYKDIIARHNLHTAKGVLEAMKEAKTLDVLERLSKYISEVGGMKEQNDLLSEYGKLVLKIKESNNQEFTEDAADLSAEGGEEESFSMYDDEEDEEDDDEDTSEENKDKKNFVNGTNMDLLKDAKTLELQKNISTFVAKLADEENDEAVDELFEIVAESLSKSANDITMGEVEKYLLDKEVDTTSNNIDTILEILKNCR